MSDAPVDGQDPETEQRPPTGEAAGPAEPAEASAPAEPKAAPGPAAPAKEKFDVFAAKGAPLPFSEAPDLEAEAEEEERAASPEAETTVLRVPANDPRSEEHTSELRHRIASRMPSSA